jgi:voltage-gated potassium channel
MSRTIKKRIHDLFAAKQGGAAGRIIDFFIMGLILLNVVAVILDTEKTIAALYQKWFWNFEVFSVLVFTVEYLLRLYSCTEDKKYERPFWGRVRFIFSPLALIDLFAILPFYLPMLFRLDLRILRAVRLVRLFRLLKLGRYSESIRSFLNVFRSKKEDLVLTMVIVFILLVIFSSLLFFSENTAQPQNFSSIPATMWWTVIAMSNIGSSDFYPVTLMGKIVSVMIGILGITLFALPAGIIGSGFVEEIQKKRAKQKNCPHCGKPLE